MLSSELPWRDRGALTDLTASWQTRLAGRALFRVSVGPGWIGLHLAGARRNGIYLVARPGAVLLWDSEGPLPPAVREALGLTRRSPLARRLTGLRLTGATMVPDDKVVALRFVPDQSLVSATTADTTASLTLLHQAFGSRGNTALLDERDQLIWSHYRPLHPALTRTPDAAAAAPYRSADDPAARFRDEAPDHLTRSLVADLSGRLLRVLRQTSRSQRRLVENLTRDLDQARRGDEFRRQAETLAANLHRLGRGRQSIELPSPHDGQVLRIALNPALDGPANLDHYFRLARKAERGRAVIADRLAAAQSRLDDLERRAASLGRTLTTAGPAQDPVRQLAGLLDWREHNSDLPGLVTKDAARKPGRDRSADDAARPFRRYRIEQRWEVWVGRNNAENDTLTHRSAAPDDIWLHAQGVAGSHVILRTAGKPEHVPGRVLEKAACLAALHSKARHSQLVPVIFTRRKYVRKPRKSPPGTAVCEREKSLFVAPGVVAGVAAI